MARLACEEKLGFYPTPPEETELIASLLRTEPGSNLNVLDPCCGEGAALKRMADVLRNQGADVCAYGVELEENRAAKARAVLDRVLHCPYEDAMVTPKAFSFLFLNPPYIDYGGGKRAEVVFLRDLTDGSSGKLCPGGLLAYVVPEYIVPKAARLLAARFKEVHIYRFTEKNYPVYKQVVVFGYKRPRTPSRDEFEKTLSRIVQLEDIPALDEADQNFVILPSPEVKTFEPFHLPAEEIAQELKLSSAWEKAKSLLPKGRSASAMRRPALPLKPAHMAVAIATGAVGGNVGHLLVGMTKKITTKEIIPGEDGHVEVITESPKTAIRVFSADGVFELE